MIITAEEYFSKLHLTYNENAPQFARLLPSADNVYHINAKTREISAPESLGIERDHRARTIYFAIDQRVDYMDLSQTCCVIQYRNNATKLSSTYIVPFYDIYTCAADGKMLIPWSLDATALSAAGTVDFAIHFYQIGDRIDIEKGIDEKIIVYSLNTVPARSKVLPGLSIKKENQNTDYLLNTTQYQELAAEINRISNYQQLYWTILSND